MNIIERAQELQDAIRHGQVDHASRLARILAELRAQVIVQVQRISHACASSSCSRTVRLKIRLDSRFTSSVEIFLNVDPAMTFGDLKDLVYENFNFPRNLQNCMVMGHSPADNETLLQYGLCVDDCTMEIYALCLDVHTDLSATQGHGAFAGVNGHVAVNFVQQVPAPVMPDVVQRIMESGGENYQPASPAQPSWSCVSCTYSNHFAMHMCEICETPRPLEQPSNRVEVTHVDCDVVDSANKTKQDVPDVAVDMVCADCTDGADNTMQRSRSLDVYDDLMAAELAAEFYPLVENAEPFDCAICFTTIDKGCGITLRDCRHTFCRTCLEGHISHSENAIVTCPYSDGKTKCQSSLQDREIRALVSEEVYERHLHLSTREAEGQASQSYHCKTPDCAGWCTFEDGVSTFFCYACRRLNCLVCEAVHEGEECGDYQRRLRAEARRNPAAMAKLSLEQLMKFGDAMKCPTCTTIIIKDEGCDWVQCTVCKLEICWATHGPRWGPRGHGDTSGGCQCRLNNGQLCHPLCQNCH